MCWITQEWYMAPLDTLDTQPAELGEGGEMPLGGFADPRGDHKRCKGCEDRIAETVLAWSKLRGQRCRNSGEHAGDSQVRPAARVNRQVRFTGAQPLERLV